MQYEKLKDVDGENVKYTFIDENLMRIKTSSTFR